MTVSVARLRYHQLERPREKMNRPRAENEKYTEVIKTERL